MSINPIKSKELQQEYKTLKPEENSWSVIQKLNKLYRVDHILLKHAYDKYPELSKLTKSNEYQYIEKFYRYVFDNLQKIEQEYLTDWNSTEKQLLTTYEINKSSISKFVRDQNEHYRKVFKKVAQAINEDEQGINGVQILEFMKACFGTKYTQVILNGESYFEASDIQQQIAGVVKNYFVEVKGVELESFLIENSWVEENQILDFLSFWIKEYESEQLYVLYGRTEEKLKKDVQFLKRQVNKIRKMQQNGEKVVESPKHPMVQPLEELQASKSIQELNTINQDNSVPSGPSKIQELAILKKYRNNNSHQEQSPFPKQPKLSKKQQFQKKLPQLFAFGCKRRYPLPKGTTFEQIQEESKKMNLQKFINFCNYFEITQYLSRQLLSEIFKMYAFNRRTIDLVKFQIIMERVIQTDIRVIDAFLNKKHPQKQLREKDKSKLSSYKFKLRPINGKEVQSLEEEIKEKKLGKEKIKEEKLLNFYIQKYQKKVSKKGALKPTVSESLLPERTNLFELQNIRDDNFDPQKYFGDDDDELLSAYESKMQKKGTTPSLESVLSRRIERGEKIVKKITMGNLKLYQ